jgi:hypothetical protein
MHIFASCTSLSPEAIIIISKAPKISKQAAVRTTADITLTLQGKKFAWFEDKVHTTQKTLSALLIKTNKLMLY